VDALQPALRRGLTLGAAGLGALLLGLVGTAAPVHAGDGDEVFDGESRDGGGLVRGTDPGGTGSGPDIQPISGGAGPSGPQGPWTEEHLVPACMHSSLGQNEDVMCAGATTSCPEEGDTRWRVYERLVDQDGPRSDWAYAGTRCEGPETSGGVQEPEVTRQDVVDSAYAAAPVPDFVIEPADESYVNVPTNFAATGDDAPVTVTVHPLGIAIPVTFTPTSYQWDFGDGATGSGHGVRHADVGAAGAVEHAYAASGSYDVTLTRVYTISFTLPGGGSVSIPGEVSRSSEPQTLDVGEIQSTVTGVS